MLRILFLFSLIIASNNVQAQDPIQECFADSKSNTKIFVCLAIENAKIENVRKTIEKELIEIIKEEPYIVPQYLKEEIKTDAAGLSFKSPSGKIVKSHNGAARTKAILEEVLRQKTLRENLYKEKRIESDILRHTKEKDDRIERHIESTVVFEQYRELECSRLREYFVGSNPPSLARYKYRICLYDLTKQRIKSLQKSIEN